MSNPTSNIDALTEMANTLLCELKELKKAQEPGTLTVRVRLPTKWMVEYFIDWARDAFPEHMLGNEGQHLTSHAEGNTVIFARGPQE